jgi:hypothetical protein
MKGKPKGKGILIYPASDDLRSYAEGVMEAGRMQGQWVVTFRNGTSHSYEYLDDEMVQITSGNVASVTRNNGGTTGRVSRPFFRSHSTATHTARFSALSSLVAFAVRCYRRPQKTPKYPNVPTRLTRPSNVPSHMHVMHDLCANPEQTLSTYSLLLLSLLRSLGLCRCPGVMWRALNRWSMWRALLLKRSVCMLRRTTACKR